MSSESITFTYEGFSGNTITHGISSEDGVTWDEALKEFLDFLECDEILYVIDPKVKRKILEVVLKRDI